MLPLHHDCPSYFPVVFDAQPQVAQHALVLSREQLARHLARPGCLTDRLDHPLHCARSGIDTTKDFDRAALLDELRGQYGQPSTLFTAVSVLNGLTFVLASVSKITSLALTGILERAVDWSAASLPRNQPYSVGPFLVPTPVRLPALSSLEELHLCDVDWTVQEADDTENGFPALRHFT